MKKRDVAVAIAVVLGTHMAYAEDAEFSPMVVKAPAINESSAFSGSEVSEESLATKRASTSDTASLLKDVSGVSLNGAGGVSSLPAIHGMADDRVRVQTDGMDLISACPNHMNPPLSYLDPTNVESVKVYAGITPVSVGGDSIGGTIQVNSPAPVFAQSGQGTLVKGQVGGFYRSNGKARGENVSATMASENVSLTYSGSTAQSDNYKAGGDFKTFTSTGNPGQTLPLDEVGSTAYKTENHNLGLAVRNGNHVTEAKVGFQDIPYELYPNQRMDMLGNTERRFSLRDLGQYNWGSLEMRAYHENVQHYMNFGEDKQFWYGISATIPGMPMNTESKTTGASLKASVDLSEQDILRVGGEYQRYRLNDWWSPSGGMMAPDTFWNINGGKRDRAAAFGEWESHISPQWLTLFGARYEHVRTDTGPVDAYSTTVPPDQTRFNSLDRQKTDNNWDLTALARYTSEPTRTIDFGYARKTRSPNLYERYSWFTGAMEMVMNNFVGDGNGYVGDPNLKPEVAHTLSTTFDWHAADRNWEFKAAPYYTRVTDYIDAERCTIGNCSTMLVTSTNKFVQLQYVNQDARLYGIDLSGHMPLAKTGAGEFGVKGLLNYTNGKNLETGDGLYNIMPLNATLTMTQKVGGWDNGVEVVMVKSKTDVSEVRNEIRTPGYSLLNLRGSYSWKQASVNFGVENVFDRLYYLPTGGAYTGQGMTMSINGIPWGIAVPGMGRSFYTGVTVKI